jgi:phytol kinase
MSVALQITLALGSVVVLLGLMGVVRHFAKIWDILPEVQRKLIHIGTGLYALCLPWLFPDRWPVYFLIMVTLIVMLFLRMPNSRLGKTLHGVERQSYGDLLLALSVGLCLLLAGDDLYLYVLPIAVLTLADAAAALAGSTYGTRFLIVDEGQKSVEGSVVFFVVTMLLSMICLMLMTTIPPANIIILSAMVGGFGAFVEASSWRGFDNLFLPMGLLIFLAVHAQSTLPELLTLTALFAASIVVFRLTAPKVGLSNHAANVYVITVFLLLAVTAPQNAVMPILALAAHAWSRSAAPCTSKYPDLDIVAGLALISFGWLVLGNTTGWNAISFYGLTAMGMMVGLSVIALSKRGLVMRVAILGGIAALACLLRAGIINLNPENTNWNGPMWPATIATLALLISATSFLPDRFSHARVTKLTLLSLVIPLATYLFSVDFSQVIAGYTP